MSLRSLSLLLPALLLALPGACSSEESTVTDGDASAGSSGTGGASGAAGSTATGGSAGVGGGAGSGGSAGGGTGGATGGSGGTAGAGAGGTAGAAGTGGVAGTGAAAGTGGTAGAGGGGCVYIDDPSYMLDCTAGPTIINRWSIDNVPDGGDPTLCPTYWTVDYGDTRFGTLSAAAASASCTETCLRQRSTAVMVLRCGHRDEYTTWEDNRALDGGADAGEGGTCPTLFETTDGIFTTAEEWLALPCPDQ